MPEDCSLYLKCRYTTFGSPMPGRKFVSGTKYKYGFQNQEEDPEIWGGAVSFKYRIEDSRLGKFFSCDPLESKYPWNSPYAFSENRVIDGVELEGLEVELLNGQTGPYSLNNPQTKKQPQYPYFNLNSKTKTDAKTSLSTSDIILATVGTITEGGKVVAEKIIKSRSGFTSGKISPKSPLVFSKEGAKNIQTGAKALGVVLSLYSAVDTEQQYRNGEISENNREGNHINNVTGTIFPVAAIPMAVGNYYGQKYEPEITGSLTKPGGVLFEVVKLSLELVGISTTDVNSKPAKK